MKISPIAQFDVRKNKFEKNPQSKNHTNVINAPNYANFSAENIRAMSFTGNILFKGSSSEEKTKQFTKDELLRKGYSVAEVKNGKISTAQDKIILSRTEDLIALSNTPEAWDGKRFVLSDNIDLSSVENWGAIGDNKKPFSGAFDGNGQTISNLRIDNDKNNQGLFGYIENASVHNLSLDNASIKSENQSGILAGVAKKSKLSQCFINGEISGNQRVGGLIGIASNCEITDISSNARIVGKEDIGGIIAFDANSNIVNVYSKNKLLGKNNVGSILGYGSLSQIKDAEIYSNINGESNIGNIIGKSKNSDIENIILVSDNAFNEIGLNKDSEMKNICRNKDILSLKCLNNFDKNIWKLKEKSLPHLNFWLQDKTFEQVSKEDLPIYMNILNHLPDEILESDFIDVNIENEAGETPLYYCNNTRQADLLIKKGADVLHKDKNNQTPIYKYCSNGNLEIIKKLLENGVSLDEKNLNYETPLDIAIQNSNHNIVQSFKNGLKGFSKVIGMSELKQTLIDNVIEPLKNIEENKKYGLSMSNGILLYGLPGCGKTFIAEALAEETGRSFYKIKSSDISTHYAGDSARAIKDIFTKARNNSPSIIFIDEMDGIAPSRDALNDSGSAAVAQDMKERVTELLQQMNSSAENGIFVIGAANNPEQIDSAIKRPGRLDKRIFVPPPDLNARIGLFRKELKNRPIEDNIFIKELAKKTPNYTAEEIRLIVDEAAIVAKREKRKISNGDLLIGIKVIKPSISQKMIDDYRAKSSTTETISIQNENNDAVKGFNGVAGMNELKGLLKKDIIEPLQKTELYKKYGLNTSNGILLYGPPGCGKTHIANALAEEADRYFVKMKPSSVVSPYTHQTALNIKKIFEEAIYNKPSILFIDEIEALAPSRNGYNLHNDTKEQVTELLQQINNCSEHNVFVIAATNHPEQIDEAIKRTGRFDKKIFVTPPDAQARKELFEKALKNVYKDENIDFDILAELTNGYTAPQIFEAKKMAAHMALDEEKPINQEHLSKAIEKIQPELPDDVVEQYKNL